MKLAKKFLTLALVCSMTISSAVCVFADDADQSANQTTVESAASDDAQVVLASGEEGPSYVKSINKTCENTGSIVNVYADGTSLVKSAYNAKKSSIRTQLKAKYKGVTYKVNAVYTSAFSNNKQAKSCVVTSNITKIYKNAFAGSSIKTVRFDRINLGKVTFAKGAFNNSSITKIKVPAKSYSKYVKALRAAGYTGKIVKF